MLFRSKNLNKIKTQITWMYLSRHPSAISLLEQNPDKINWQFLSYNTSPSAIRLFEENLNKIENMIRNTKGGEEYNSLRQFPGFHHENVYNHLDNLSFEARSRLVDILKSAEAQKLGAPNVDKITRATLDPKYAGLNRGDVMYLIKLSKDEDNLVDLEKHGLTKQIGRAHV